MTADQKSARGVNRVSARRRDTGLTAGKTPPLGHFTRNIGRQGINRPAKRSRRHNRSCRPSQNIADGACCRNAAKIKRAVDYRHKEAGGADNTGAITQIKTAASSRVSLPTSRFGSTNFACRSLCRIVSVNLFRNFTTATSAVAVLRFKS